ncbi:Phytochrome-like protein cph2 [Anoxybacillus sp. BCO1]|nr:Phytochrome-like protein cph2 [Anoxybacillus sp. BCO1]
METFPKAIIICTDQQITYANTVALHMFKASTIEDVRNKPVQQWIHTVPEPTITTIDGETIPVQIDILPFPYETNRTELMIIKPSEPIVVHENKNVYISRTEFMERLTDLLLAHEGVAILLVDVHQFKFINSFLGYENGDEILRQISMRLHNTIHPKAIWTRMNGDQFAIALSYESQEEVKQFANVIKEVLIEPYPIAQQQIRIGIHIGISYAYDAKLCAETLLNNAEKALYFAKLEGTSGIKPYKAHMSDAFTRKIQLENALSSAVKNGELFCFISQKSISTHVRLVSKRSFVGNILSLAL